MDARKIINGVIPHAAPPDDNWGKVDYGQLRRLVHDSYRAALEPCEHTSGRWACRDCQGKRLAALEGDARDECNGSGPRVAGAEGDE